MSAKVHLNNKYNSASHIMLVQEKIIVGNEMKLNYNCKQ